MTVKTAARMRLIQPFHVMALLARARELEAAGRSIIHMEIGEPDFVTPQPLIDAGIRALQDGRTHYTPATGLWELREKIAGFYQTRYGITVEPERIVVTPGASAALQLVLERIVVTPGASAALQLVLAVLVNAGDQVLLADPGYPCNRNFVDASSGYQPAPQQVNDYWTDRTRALLVASPSNPTGTLLDDHTLREYHSITGRNGGSLIVDEIYHGLTYDGPVQTALAVSDDIFVINSFSKYFGMTGWRLGWLIAPREVIPELEKLAQNLFLAAPTLAQYAALRAFDDEVIAILDARRDEFRLRRDYLLPALRDIGFEIPVAPAGAFYLYANCSRFTDDSYGFAERLLEEEGVAVTPGIDFGSNQPERHVRFAYTTSLENLQEGVRRLAEQPG